VNGRADSGPPDRPQHIEAQAPDRGLGGRCVRDGQWAIPSEEIERTPHVYDDRRRPTVLFPAYSACPIPALLLGGDVGVDALSFTSWVNKGISDNHQQRLRLLENSPRSPGGLACQKPNPQIFQHLSPLCQIGRLHPELLMHGQIAAVFDNRESFVAGAVARDRAFGELVGDYQPEGGVLFVVGVVGCSRLGFAQNVYKLVTVERQAGYSTNSAAQIQGKVA